MAAKKWGWWTRHKLQILEDYLASFARASKGVTERIYLDLFAGWPENVARETDALILGSARRALSVEPPFTRVCLFELGEKARRLEKAIRDAYPGRPGIRVYDDDCNVTVARALQDLRSVNWAPTFAFVDQFDSEVKWSTLEQIARFRRGKTKAEMWILFATGMYPRGLNLHGQAMNASYGDTLTEMLGSEEWIPIAQARRSGRLSPAQARDEWVNLVRWRLERELGYRKSYGFTMKNTGGQDIYDMIFVTDHDAGDRIMRHLYGKALGEHQAMRQHALALRRDKRAQDKGEAGLFDIAPEMVAAGKLDDAQVYDPEPPRPPYQSR
ncbi:three-Cys-motif partner protein TcmP [Micromonospora sp. L32]|uniref:three-Cys-motif partner protein TcmP n=1 Tax=Micromonospora sp. L32 TaxID=3452214 RepID=UPI003F894B85